MSGGAPPARPAIRVLVVDDDGPFRRTIITFLASAGMVADGVGSARELLERDPARDPDCLVVDLFMPGMDGLELQEAMVRAGRKVPMVFVSGMADVPRSVRAMRAGASDFLEKPFEGRALIEAVTRATAEGTRAAAERRGREDARARLARLTPREKQVCELVAQGLANKEIASLLGVSEHTTKVHRANALAKLGTESVPDLVRLVDRSRER